METTPALAAPARPGPLLEQVFNAWVAGCKAPAVLQRLLRR